MPRLLRRSVLLAAITVAVSCGEPEDSCFVEGTPIATPDGDVPIERLRVGDRVWSHDPATGRSVAGWVTAVHEHADRPVGRLIASNGQELGVTAEHPVYSVTLARFVPAGELTQGTALGSFAGDRHPLHVSLPLHATGRARVFNISVAPHPTYFAAGVLVHNKRTYSPNSRWCPENEACGAPQEFDNSGDRWPQFDAGRGSELEAVDSGTDDAGH